MHFGASAGRADARRRDAGDAGVHRRGAATKQMPARRRGPLAVLLAPYIPHRVCSSLAPCQRAWGPAAKCTPYFLTGPKCAKGQKAQSRRPRTCLTPASISKSAEGGTRSIFNFRFSIFVSASPWLCG